MNEKSQKSSDEALMFILVMYTTALVGLIILVLVFWIFNIQVW